MKNRKARMAWARKFHADHTPKVAEALASNEAITVEDLRAVVRLDACTAPELVLLALAERLLAEVDPGKVTAESYCFNVEKVHALLSAVEWLLEVNDAYPE